MNANDEKALIQFNADQMVERLWSRASSSLTDPNLTRQDRFGYEADMRLMLLHRRLVGLGWIVETSTDGSVYYSRGGERLRLSNHEVSRTVEREYAAEAGRWSWDRCGHQIITARSSIEECIAEIDEIEEELTEG